MTPRIPFARRHGVVRQSSRTRRLDHPCGTRFLAAGIRREAERSVPFGMIFDEDKTMEGRRGLYGQPSRAWHVNGLRFGIVATKQRQRRKLLGAFARARKRIDVDQNETLTPKRGGERWKVSAQARELVLGIWATEAMFSSCGPSFRQS